jgi:hypothetical protein
MTGRDSFYSSMDSNDSNNTKIQRSIYNLQDKYLEYQQKMWICVFIMFCIWVVGIILMIIYLDVHNNIKIACIVVYCLTTISCFTVYIRTQNSSLQYITKYESTPQITIHV